MVDASKPKGENRADKPIDHEIVERQSTEPAEPDGKHSGRVVRWLPNQPRASPGAPTESTRHIGRWFLIVAAVCALALPVITWVNYRNAYVTSTNAAVRGHIAEIGTQVASRVASVEVEGGDLVEQGQVLVRLDDRYYKAEVAEAKADLTGLEQQLEVERLAIEHDRRGIAQQQREARANLDTAQAQRSIAEIRVNDAREREQARQSLFRDGGAISGEEVRSAETTLRLAEAQLQEAQSRYAAAQSAEEKVLLAQEVIAIRELKMGVLQSDVARAEARLMQAEAELANTVIRAPRDGALLRRVVEPGTSVNEGQPLVTMRLGDSLWIEAWIDEDDIGYVSIGSEAVVTLRSTPDREFKGTVDKIGLATDFEMPESEVPQPRFTRMLGAPVVGVRVQLNEPAPLLVPGMSAVVAIERTSN